MRGEGFSHAQLLVGAAPRAFFLIAAQYGSEAVSGPLLDEARWVHLLYGKADAVVMYDHHTGH